MKDAVIYARYSSDKQDEASIDAQVRACREYAASKGYAVLEVYADEAVSGKGSKTASRKAYQKLLRDVNKGRFDTILIHKYDRVARNLGEHVNLEKKLKDRAVELIAVAQDFGSSAEAKIMKTLMWSLSEYYLDNLSSETKKGHRETAMKAKHNGGYAPFGYDVVNQEYVVNELEAGYVRKIFDAAANREGFTAIIEELKKLYDSDIPLFGVCLGHQLLALATGAKTGKLAYGHRGGNHPVRDLEKGRVFITSQNHGYMVLADSVDPAVAEVSHVNVNDGTCEGLRYKRPNCFTTQFHPEANAGPKDTEYLFNRFIDSMGGDK